MLFSRTRKVWLVTALLVLAISSIALASKQYDFGGRVVGVSIRSTGYTPFGEKNQYDWYNPDGRLRAHIEEVEKRFNVKLNFIEHPKEWNPMNFAEEILAGDNYVSIFETDFNQGVRNLLPLALGGYLTPLDEYLDEEYYASLPSLFQQPVGFQVQGRTYGIEANAATIEPVIIAWNKDLFDREGFIPADELYHEGEWTWDIFKEYAMDATKDLDGDGEIDQWGLSWFWDRNPMLINFVFTNNASFTRVIDGKEVVTIDEPAFVEAMEFVQELMAYGVSKPASSHPVGSQVNTAMTIAIPESLHTPGFQSLPDEHGVVPLPMGPRAEDYVFPTWNRWMAVIPVTEPDPAAVIELWKALRVISWPYIEEQFPTYTSMQDWEDDFWSKWNMVFTDRTTYEVWQRAAWDRTVNVNRSLVMENGLNQAIERILQGDSITSTLASVKGQIQSALDELYRQ